MFVIVMMFSWLGRFFQLALLEIIYANFQHPIEVLYRGGRGGGEGCIYLAHYPDTTCYVMYIIISLIILAVVSFYYIFVIGISYSVAFLVYGCSSTSSLTVCCGADPIILMNCV